jgi:hypothetical protein
MKSITNANGIKRMVYLRRKVFPIIGYFLRLAPGFFGPGSQTLFGQDGYMIDFFGSAYDAAERLGLRQRPRSSRPLGPKARQGLVGLYGTT